jgi:hypothetical protein
LLPTAGIVVDTIGRNCAGNIGGAAGGTPPFGSTGSPAGIAGIGLGTGAPAP